MVIISKKQTAACTVSGGTRLATIKRKKEEKKLHTHQKNSAFMQLFLIVSNRTTRL